MGRKTGLSVTIVLSAVLALLGCRNRKNVAEHIMEDPAHELAAAAPGRSSAR